MQILINRIIINHFLYLVSLVVGLMAMANTARATNSASLDNFSSQYLEVFQQENRAEIENYLKLTPIIKAVKEHNAKAIQVFVDAGVNVNAQTLGGATALHLAAADNDLESLKILLLNNAAVNKRDNELWTPLMRAALRGNLEALQILLAVQGVDLLTTNKFGETALLHATIANCTECVMAILDAIDNAPYIEERVILEQLDRAEQLAKQRKNQELLSTIQEYRQHGKYGKNKDNETLIDVYNVQEIGRKVEDAAMQAENIESTGATTQIKDTSGPSDFSAKYRLEKRTTTESATQPQSETLSSSKPLEIMQVNSGYRVRYNFLGRRIKNYDAIAKQTELEIRNLLKTMPQPSEAAEDKKINPAKASRVKLRKPVVDKLNTEQSGRSATAASIPDDSQEAREIRFIFQGNSRNAVKQSESIEAASTSQKSAFKFTGKTTKSVETTSAKKDLRLKKNNTSAKQSSKTKFMIQNPTTKNYDSLNSGDLDGIQQSNPMQPVKVNNSSNSKLNSKRFRFAGKSSQQNSKTAKPKLQQTSIRTPVGKNNFQIVNPAKSTTNYSINQSDSKSFGKPAKQSTKSASKFVFTGTKAGSTEVAPVSAKRLLKPSTDTAPQQSSSKLTNKSFPKSMQQTGKPALQKTKTSATESKPTVKVLQTIKQDPKVQKNKRSTTKFKFQGQQTSAKADK